MLHESVLTKADIVLLFRELYNIERIQDIQLINEGSAGVYLTDFDPKGCKIKISFTLHILYAILSEVIKIICYVLPVLFINCKNRKEKERMI